MCVDMESYKGKCLVFIKEFGPIPMGSFAYCIEERFPKNDLDPGHIRIILSKPVLGMTEFKIPHTSKNCFKIR